MNPFRTSYRQLKDTDRESLEDQSDTETIIPRKHPSENWWIYRNAFFGLLVLYLLTIALFLTHWNEGAWLSPKPEQNEEGYTSLSSLLKMPHDQEVLFEPNLAFEEMGEMGVDEDPWRDILPNGRGFINVPVVKTFENGTVGVENETYCISMFHQLHCIASLKSLFSSLTNPNTSSPNSPSSTTSAHHRTHEHLSHCFDYLRQSIMCAGDMALEPAVQFKKSKIKTVEGWNATHQCRNYEVIYEWAEGNRYMNTGSLASMGS